MEDFEREPPESWLRHHAPLTEGDSFQSDPDCQSPAVERPQLRWCGPFSQNRDGLILRLAQVKDPETDKRVVQLVPVAGPVEIVALTSGPAGEACIRLRWMDFRQIERQADVPFAALSSLRSNFLHENLIGRGLRIVPGKERDFCDALRSVEVRRVIRSLDRSGWDDLDAAPLYADPAGRIYGGAADTVALSNPTAASGAFSPIGTLNGWNAMQGRLAEGNSRLAFFVSAALAGPLLRPVGEASGALHLVGLSGDGKSTALRLAGSVWGGPAHVGTWRSTANGWEATCAQASDAILIADELSQANPKDAAAVVFMVGNESGARRMTKTLDAQAVRTWKTLLLSAGEESLEDMLRRDRQEFRGGLETRFLTIPSDAGKGFRVYDTLHGFASDNALSVALAKACQQDAGHAGPAFLERLVAALRADQAAFAMRWTDYRTGFLRSYAGEGADGPMLRACSKFALVAFAGTLGIEWGALPWPAGHAEWAAVECWRAWVGARGHSGDSDTAQAIDALRTYLTAHGLSRFPLLVDGTAQQWERLPEHAGFRRATADGGVEYLVNPATWRDLMRGKSPTSTAKRLKEAGLYRRERRKINGLAQIDYHVVSGRLLED